MPRLHPHLITADPTRLPGQFVLGREADVEPPAGWHVATANRWMLATHPTLRHARLLDAGGGTVGWLLGEAVTAAGELVRDALRLPTASTWAAACEILAGELTGRFLIALVAGPQPRVYPDAYAMLAAVFAAEPGVLASTTGLVPPHPATPYDLERIRAVDIPYTNAMYPLGLTPRVGVERLLPNHYLDLAAWRLHRRWPTGDGIGRVAPEDAGRLTAAVATRSIAALARAYPLECPLTAGRDSRLLLACARPVLDRATFFTAHLTGDATGWRDVTVARTIAARFGLRHRVLPARRAHRRDLHDWVARTGGEVGEVRGWCGDRTFQQMDADRATLIGWAGDIARPFYWKDSAITAEDLLAICEVPPLPLFLARAQQWLDALPTAAPNTVMDLFFAEQRGGCWAGTVEYAAEGRSRAMLPPLCNQAVVRALMAMPDDYRIACTFERDVIAALWPELAALPFNEQVPVPAWRQRYFDAAAAIAQLGPRARGATRRARHEPMWLLRKAKRMCATPGPSWTLPLLAELFAEIAGSPLF